MKILTFWLPFFRSMLKSSRFLLQSTIMTLFHNKHLLRCLAASEHGSEHLMLLPRYDCSLDQKCAELHASSMDRQLLVCLLMKVCIAHLESTHNHAEYEFSPLQMLIAVCEGLQSLHSRAVIHRGEIVVGLTLLVCMLIFLQTHYGRTDLKPQNVLVKYA